MTEEVIAAQPEVTPVQNEVTPPVDETATPTEEAQPEPKPERTFNQKEVDDIIQRRLAKEQRKAERLARAEAENQVLKQQLTPPAQPQSQGAPKPEQFQTYEDYLDSLTDWKVEQKLKATHEAQAREYQRRAQLEHEGKIVENLRKAAAKFDDFDEVVANPSLPVTAAMRDAIGESEIGGEIAYHLGMNIEEAERIAALSPVGQVRAILALEQKLREVPEKKTTDAPPPITPNVGKAKVEKDPSQMTDKEFAEWRKRQIAQRR